MLEWVLRYGWGVESDQGSSRPSVDFEEPRPTQGRAHTDVIRYGLYHEVEGGVKKVVQRVGLNRLGIGV